MDIHDGMVSKFLDWKRSQERAIEKREKKVVSQLLNAVPKSLGQWLEEEGVDFIGGLVARGNESGTLKFLDQKGRGAVYGYDDFREFRGRFEVDLKTAWKGIIDVDVEEDGDYKFSVTFKVV